MAGLALFDGVVRAELSWVAGRKHSVQLLPQLKRLFDLVDFDLTGLTGVVAARGPGSFTGVRVGLAAAQGLAVALDVPAYGICSLDVLAAGFEATDLPIRPLLDAGRGRFASALYRWRNGRLERLSDIIGVELANLIELIDQPCLLCGDLNLANRERIQDMLGERATLASPASSLRRPGILAQLGWQQRAAGASGEPVDLQPLYLST